MLPRKYRKSAKKLVKDIKIFLKKKKKQQYGREQKSLRILRIKAC